MVAPDLEKPVIISKVNSINLGGIDLSSYVTDAGFELSPWQESVLDGLPAGSMTLDFTSFWNTPRSFTFEVTWDQLHPDTQAYFRALFADLRRRRLSRMRSAYRRRRR